MKMLGSIVVLASIVATVPGCEGGGNNGPQPGTRYTSDEGEGHVARESDQGGQTLQPASAALVAGPSTAALEDAADAVAKERRGEDSTTPAGVTKGGAK